MEPIRDVQRLLTGVYGVCVLGAACALYVKTLAPTVSFFDSGELIAAAATLGVAHPPGYPLYVLLGWLFSHLPLGAAAYRLNLMSACFGALAALMAYSLTYLLLTERTRPASHDGNPDPERMLQPVFAMIAGLTFAYSLTHWRQSVVAEVYALNAFLCGLILVLLLVWRRSQEENHPLSPPYRHGIFALKGLWNAARGFIPWRFVHRTAALKGQQEYPSPFQGAERRFPYSGDESPGCIPQPFQGKAADLKSPISPSSITRGQGVVNLWLLYLVAYLFGLGFGNHQTIILFSIPAAFLVLATTPRILRRPLPLALIVLSFALGLTIYGLVPLRAAANPPINWGHATTWQQFKWLVLREGYQDVPRGEALSTLWNDLLGREPKPVPEEERDPLLPPPWRSKERGLARIGDVFVHSLFFRQLQTVTLVRQFGAVGTILIGFGLCYGFFRHRTLTAALLLGIVSFVLIVVFIGDPPDENIFLVEEFHTPVYLLCAALMGLGMMAAARGMLWLAAPRGRLWQYGVVFGVSMTFLMIPAALMLGNIKQADSSRTYVAQDYAMNIFASLQPNAIVFTWGDSGAFPLWYLQIVEGVRPDVTVIHVPHLGLGWYRAELPAEFFQGTPADDDDIIEYLLQIVDTQMDTRPIYFDYSSVHSIELPVPLLPNGITYKLQMPGDALDDAVWTRYQFRGILDDTRIAMDSDIERVILIYGAALGELGQYYMQAGATEKAAQAFNNAVKFDPSLGEEIIKELHFRNKLAAEPPQ